MYQAYGGGGGSSGGNPWRRESTFSSSSRPPRKKPKQMPKRERSGSSSASRRWRPGYDRTGGFYALLKGEKKFHDDGIDGTMTTAGVVEPSLNLIPQGVTEKTRVGRQAFIHSLHIQGRLMLDTSSTATNSGDCGRIIVYVDHQCNGSAAAVTDILQGAAYKQFRNLSNKQRFTILSDQKIDMPPPGFGSNGTDSITGRSVQWYSFHKYFKKPLPVQFDSTTGAITEIATNNIGVICISSNANLEFALNSRVRFTD